MYPMRHLSNKQARHIFLDRHGLGQTRHETLEDIITALGFVQLDSINTVARAHHMILHARQQSYRQPHFDRLHKNRALFEHWTHDASVIPAQFFKHWRHKAARDATDLRKRYRSWRRDGFEEKMDAVLEQIKTTGACCSSDVGAGEKRGSGGWWDWHPSKTALEYLWRSGEISVTKRVNFRKFYDLTEHVIAPEHFNARASEDETLDWACMGALSRLGFATSGEIAGFWAIFSPAEVKAWCDQALSQNRICEIGVGLNDGSTRKCLTIPDIAEVPPPPERTRILSPFDPALRDRKRAERLFGFHYRIEIFVPEAKRTYGYYVFPVLEGDRLIGRIDMKADSKTHILNVASYWPEDGKHPSKARLSKLQTAIRNTARLAKCRDIEFAPGWIRGAS